MPGHTPIRELPSVGWRSPTGSVHPPLKQPVVERSKAAYFGGAGVAGILILAMYCCAALKFTRP
jgi:hypothetical protein